MSALNIRTDSCALDFLSLGALVHRLDPGIIPFRKATQCQIHVSGGEFNVAANLSDCFGLNTGVATAMVDYPIGDLIAERVRAMGVKPFYKKGHDWNPLKKPVYDYGYRYQLFSEGKPCFQESEVVLGRIAEKEMNAGDLEHRVKSELDQVLHNGDNTIEYFPMIHDEPAEMGVRR